LEFVAHCAEKGSGTRGFLLYQLINNNTLHTSATTNFEYHEYPLVDIQGWTNHFDECRIIEVGGFGKVYRGQFTDGRKVEVKRTSLNSRVVVENLSVLCKLQFG
jgi:hypothetical protein